jgi:hypothetical protein
VQTTAPDTQPLPSIPTLTVALDTKSVESIVAAVAERLTLLLPQQVETGWLDAPAAASYLGISTTALHKLTSSRLLAFSQSAPGGRCYFRRADLDAYREQSMKGG